MADMTGQVALVTGGIRGIGLAMEKIIDRIPMHRLGDPGEVARVAEFLADPESAYITGQAYAINGGLYM